MHCRMRTTIEIADNIFEEAQTLACKQGTTLQSLVEEGLCLVFAQSHANLHELPPLITYGEGGLADEFKDANWKRIRDETYRGQGA